MLPVMSALFRETSASAFERHPVGRFVKRARWAYFCLSEELFGYALFGRVRAEDVEELTSFMVQELRRRPHHVLAHVSHLHAAEPAAFTLLGKYIETHRAALGDVVTAAAIVRPTGISGAIAGGFFSVIPAPFHVEVFDNSASALDCLGARDSAQLAISLDESVATWMGMPPIVAALRTHLASSLVQPDIDAAAAALSVSTRTLQRKLTAEGTRFQREVMLARLEAVIARLEESDHPLAAIAFDTGFSSPQHMSRAFRKHVGQSPGDYRAGCR